MWQIILALEDLADFQNDREIVLRAVGSNGLALQFASEELRNAIL